MNAGQKAGSESFGTGLLIIWHSHGTRTPCHQPARREPLNHSACLLSSPSWTRLSRAVAVLDEAGENILLIYRHGSSGPSPVSAKGEPRPSCRHEHGECFC